MGNQNELTGNTLVAHGRLYKPLRTETSTVIGLWHTRRLLEQLHGTQQSVQVAPQVSLGTDPGCSSGRKTGRGVCGCGLLRRGVRYQKTLLCVLELWLSPCRLGHKKGDVPPGKAGGPWTFHSGKGFLRHGVIPMSRAGDQNLCSMGQFFVGCWEVEDRESTTVNSIL